MEVAGHGRESSVQADALGEHWLQNCAGEVRLRAAKTFGPVKPDQRKSSLQVFIGCCCRNCAGEITFVLAVAAFAAPTASVDNATVIATPTFYLSYSQSFYSSHSSCCCPTT